MAADTTHTVVEGDNMWSLAKAHYGKGSMWHKIADANKDTVPDPDKLKIGTVLTIPA